MTEEHLSEGIKKRIFELTHALYRVTGLFPRDENLRYALRQEASDLLKKSAQYSVLPQATFQEIFDIIAKIRGIQSLLMLARLNDFVFSSNIDILESEYALMENFFLKKLTRVPQEKSLGSKGHALKQKGAYGREDISGDASGGIRSESFEASNALGVNKQSKQSKISPALIKNKKTNQERENTIREILVKIGKGSIKDIAVFFKDISTKTIQRDLQALVESGVVERVGDRRWAVYSLKSVYLPTSS